MVALRRPLWIFGHTQRLGSPLADARNAIFLVKNGRGDRIRTCGPLVPNQVRYQTAPLPDANGLIVGGEARGASPLT